MIPNLYVRRDRIPDLTKCLHKFALRCGKLALLKLLASPHASLFAPCSIIAALLLFIFSNLGEVLHTWQYVGKYVECVWRDWYDAALGYGLGYGYRIRIWFRPRRSRNVQRFLRGWIQSSNWNLCWLCFIAAFPTLLTLQQSQDSYGRNFALPQHNAGHSLKVPEHCSALWYCSKADWSVQVTGSESK